MLIRNSRRIVKFMDDIKYSQKEFIINKKNYLQIILERAINLSHILQKCNTYSAIFFKNPSLDIKGRL
jgi:hypothetical protein